MMKTLDTPAHHDLIQLTDSEIDVVGGGAPLPVTQTLQRIGFFFQVLSIMPKIAWYTGVQNGWWK